MSGHNKWSKIKHQKAATDAEKSKVFSKMNRLITVEAKKANGDRNSPGLKTVIEKAKAVNMPNDNIDRAIKKATDVGSAAMESVTYEAYGPGGVALMIEGITDSKNRTAAEVRHTLSKQGIELAAVGSASWAFTRTADGWVPQTMTPISDEDGEKLNQVIESLEESEDIQNVYTNAE
jgi:YebC/PmpR family DNA-binding regulatory protein